MEGEPERKNKGRQKIEMKLIECDNARAVTFSKRKRTLFEKAKKVSAETGATIGIFLISSKGYMHAFGTSCVHSIINAYRARRPKGGDGEIPENAAPAMPQNYQPLDLLDGDPADKLKGILECQDVSYLIGPFDPTNIEHVQAAYAWFHERCANLNAKKEQLLSANLNVAYEEMVSIPSSSANPIGDFNLNVAPSADEEMISAETHVQSLNLNVTPGDDKEMVSENPTRSFNLNDEPDEDEEMIHAPS